MKNSSYARLNRSSIADDNEYSSSNLESQENPIISQTINETNITNPENNQSQEPLTMNEIESNQPNQTDSEFNSSILDRYKQGNNMNLLMLMIIITFITIVTVIIIKTPFTNYTSSQSLKTARKISNIAFGSCSGYDQEDRTIFRNSVIPSDPDVWIWAGDMVYLDDNEINCRVFQESQAWQESCNCSSSWLHRNSFSCHAADVDYAGRRWAEVLRDGPYNEFLDFMCPNSRDLGYFPPRGTDPLICERPILGIYDDHDFGWNDGNIREPDKFLFKEMFLDAIGESPISPRRGSERGIWFKYSFNADNKGEEIDIFLLDERFFRETVPCDNRRDYCEKLVLIQDDNVTTDKNYHHDRAWCEDFLLGGDLGKGSCCPRDEEIFFGWCLRDSSKESPFYREACDVTFEDFGMRALVLDQKSGDLRLPSKNDLVDQFQNSPFCEVLGKTQRRWLRKSLKESKAPLKIIVSGSVLLSNPLPYQCGSYTNKETGKSSSVYCKCSGDNLDCYRVAQRELIHLIASTSGCSVVLTGDFHFSDIKSMLPGSNHKYSDFSVYNSRDLLENNQPINQIMSSGMSWSTGRNYTCEDFRLDPLGLRTHPECSFVRGPNFGRVLVEYGDNHEFKSKSGKIKSILLQILSGEVANKVLLEHSVDLSTCNSLN